MGDLAKVSLYDQWFWCGEVSESNAYSRLYDAISSGNEKRVNWLLDQFPTSLFSIDVEVVYDRLNKCTETVSVNYQAEGLRALAAECGNKNIISRLEKACQEFSDEKDRGRVSIEVKDRYLKTHKTSRGFDTFHKTTKPYRHKA